MRRHLCGVAALLLLVLARPGVASSTTEGFSLPGYRVELEGEGLGLDAIFARIDSLESRYHDAEGAVRGRLAHRLGQLYLATDLRKHRRHALDLLEEAVALVPEGFEAGRLRAAVAQQMRYPSTARDWIEDMVEQHPGDARPHAMLGRLYFLEARRRMRMDLFEKARDSFLRAAALDSNSVSAWYGLAASAVALRDARTGRVAVDALGRLEPGAEASLFLEGALHHASGNPDRAHLVWSEALQRSDPSVRAVFEDAHGFLEPRDLEQFAERVIDRASAQAALQRLGEEPEPGEEIDWSKVLEDSTANARALSAYWSGLNSRPTQLYNPRELEYWARLVEADVLFGDPDRGIRGWDRPTGATLVRWGRPTSTFYDPGNPGGGGSILDDLDNAGVRLLPGEVVPSGVPVWAWTYKRPGAWFSLIFTDPSLSSLWSYGESSAQSAALYRVQQPLMFPPEPVARSPFRLSVSRYLYPRGDDTAVLETVVGLRPNEDFLYDSQDLRQDRPEAGVGRPDTLATVEGALYDEQERRVDYREEVLVEENRRAWLHRAVGWPHADGVLDPYVLPIGARLPAGRYRLAVEAWGPGRKGHDAVVMDVDVPVSEPPTLLEMSDLQIATAFAPYRPATGVPGRYAKFGQVVVPAADLRVPSHADRVGVYFEVLNLTRDESGQTLFDVTYEVFASSREVRNATLVSDFRRSDLDRIDPLTLTFLEERTGTSPEGLVVKGVELDIGEIGVGDYVLVVTVHDRISDRETSRALPFRKRGG